VKRGQVLLVLVLLLAIVFLVAQFDRFEEFLMILAAGHPIWIGLGVIALVGWQLAQAAQFRAAHRAAAVQQSLLSMLPVVAANNFVLIAVPTGSLSTFALFLANARRRGASAERTTVAVAIFAVFNYLALSIAIALGLLALAARHALYPLEWLPSVPIFAVALGQYAVLLLALHWPASVERVATWLAERANRLGRRLLQRDLVSVERVHTIGANAASGLVSLRQDGPRAHLLLLFYGLLSQALLAIVFGAVLLAFGQQVSLSVTLAGLGVAGLFTVVSPTPVGLGIVEAALAAVLASLGMEAGAALIVSLAFRGITLWLPVLYGFIALEALGFRAIQPKEKE
jgi:glycosyltransferase 2 family protein